MSGRMVDPQFSEDINVKGLGEPGARDHSPPKFLECQIAFHLQSNGIRVKMVTNRFNARKNVVSDPRWC